MADQTKFVLPESEMPKAWYNIQADLPFDLPPVLHPGTKQPVGPSDLAPLFPMALIQQEVTKERWVEIPEPVREVYRLWRPTPLYRAHRLEKALRTPAKIFYKYEGVSPVGSHKPNTAVAQAFYNQQEGVHRLATETGAGQWGSSLAFAGQLFGIEVKVYMVRVSYDQKPYRRHMMETWGPTVVPSPSPDTNTGRKRLAEDPDCTGSLGLKLALGRSFGIVAANRGVVSSGPYRLVRHPIYLGYLVTHAGFLLSNMSARNVLIYAAAYVFQIARIYAEERILSEDVSYREYRRCVRYRLIPGIF